MVRKQTFRMPSDYELKDGNYMEGGTMPLSKALHILADVHTQDSNVTGFVILHGAKIDQFSQWSQDDYFRAWEAVRVAAHFPVEPRK